MRALILIFLSAGLLVVALSRSLPNSKLIRTRHLINGRGIFEKCESDKDCGRGRCCMTFFGVCQMAVQYGETCSKWPWNIHRCGCQKGLECLWRSNKQVCDKPRPSPAPPFPTEEPGSGGEHLD